MGVWAITFGLQTGIFFACVVFGVIALGLSLRSAALAVLIMLPVPLYQVAGGAGSWVFAADIVALAFAARWVLGQERSEDRDNLSQHRMLLVMALLILVALPALSTFLGYAINPQPRSGKFIVLQLFRGIGYFVIFRAFLARARREDRVDRMLLLQCLAFTMVCLCGLAQYTLQVNLDLWNAVLGNPFGQGTGKLGGGFMGLYRGAVGAWAAGILAIIPVVMANRRGWNIVMPFITVAILGAVLTVGSRQGLAIGVVAFGIGLFAAVRAMPPGERLGGFLRSSLAVMLLAVVGMYGWSRISQERLGQYVLTRFQAVLNVGELHQAALQRDYRYPLAWENITSGMDMFIFGTGYGVEHLMPVHGGRIHHYIDSELFYMWQMGGTLLMVVYVLFLFVLRWSLRQSQWPSDAAGRTAAASGTVVFLAGLMLMWGHFYLLTTFSHQAPVGYWTWAIFGLAAGVCGRWYLQPAEQKAVAGAPFSSAEAMEYAYR